MLATKMYVTVPGGLVRQHLQGIIMPVGSWPQGTLVGAADGTMIRIEWYELTETWIVFCE